MPMAEMSAAVLPAFFKAVLQVATTLSQISSGSCSTQPEAGKCWVNSFCPTPATFIDPSNTIARLDVVPWSMAKTKPLMSLSCSHL